jgi:hypothetical protein
MTPAQLEAYRAVCTADPECDFQHVYFDGHAGYGAGAWRDADDALVAIPIATAAITDHLHTRLCFLQAEGKSTPVCCADGGGWWEVVNQHNPMPEMMEACLASKLSAFLAAHIVHLNLDRSLIEAMKKEEA